MAKSNVGRRVYFSLWFHVIAESQGRYLEAEADIEAMKKDVC